MPSFFLRLEQQRGCCSECACVCVRFVVRWRDRRPSLLARTQAGEDFIRLLHFWHRLPRRNRAATSAVRITTSLEAAAPASHLSPSALNLAQVGFPTRTARVFLSPGSAKDPCHAVTPSVTLAPVLASGAGKLGVVDARAPPPGLPNLGRAWHVKIKAPVAVATRGNGFLARRVRELGLQTSKRAMGVKEFQTPH